MSGRNATVWERAYNHGHPRTLVHTRVSARALASIRLYTNSIVINLTQIGLGRRDLTYLI